MSELLLWGRRPDWTPREANPDAKVPRRPIGGAAPHHQRSPAQRPETRMYASGKIASYAKECPICDEPFYTSVRTQVTCSRRCSYVRRSAG